MDNYDIILQLTSPVIPASELSRMLQDFAYEFGWKPTDLLDLPALQDTTNAHLMVEHGLENSALISFFRSPIRFSDLGFQEKEKLLSVSYNNLVDWHIQIELDGISFVYVRTRTPKIVDHYSISRDNLDNLRSNKFEQVVGRRPNPNIPALDDALIDTISFWKRNLSAELGNQVDNENLSALFNSIIFTRAIEDNYKRIHPETVNILLSAWQNNPQNNPIRTVLRNTLEQLSGQIPNFLFDEEKLVIFDRLYPDTVWALLADFYRNKNVPYPYDFSVMSKHALSRIYEHYVSILNIEDSPQLTLFPRFPEEERNKGFGSVYTPQFIARFFAKFLREQMPPFLFKRIRAADPACGSGIFLRTLLELQCDPISNGITKDLIQSAFENVMGVDVDPNACHATKLSLALLHLVLTGTFPGSVNIVNAEAIDYFLGNPELKESFDVVIANPPYISLDTQSPELRARVAEFLKDYATGRIDLYLAFLYIGLSMLKPGGYGMFVLPHSFLLSKNAGGIRDLITNSSWIQCLADLSAIRVFGDTGSYIILLMFQKKSGENEKAPLATIVKAQDLVGRALQDVIDGREVESSFYSIYQTSQDVFKRKNWLILPPTEAEIESKLSRFPALEDYLVIREGMNTGADDIFIIPENKLPSGEESIFAPYLPDQKMELYTVPDKTSMYVFYPFIDARRITESELQNIFPKTWEYLSSNKAQLNARKPVQKGTLDWWMPDRPRQPEHMLRTKIISPHLVIVPRFSIDLHGKYAVSRSPFFFPKISGAEDDFLKFFVAVLNSSACFWFISSHSHLYRGGYAMLERKTLSQIPVPDPTQVPAAQMRRLIGLVDKRLCSNGSIAFDLEKEIDDFVANLYGLTEKERLAIGMGN